MFTSLILQRIPGLQNFLNEKFTEITLAILWMTSGFFMFIAMTTWTAVKTTPGIKMTVSHPVFLGWLGLGIEFLAGLFVILFYFGCATCCRNSGGNRRQDVVTVGN